MNGLTAVSSSMVGYTLSGIIQREFRDGHLESPAAEKMLTVAMAPLFTVAEWSMLKDESIAPAITTPVSFISSQTEKIFQDKVNFAVGVAFAVAGAPGAWLGHGSGIVAHTISHSLNPVP